MMHKILIPLLLCLSFTTSVHAESNVPWGKGSVLDIEYKPNKVVYDVAVKTPGKLISVLDRASYLSKVYEADPFEASIIIVLHGDEINFFAIKNYEKYKDLMTRARSLSVGGVIKFHMCKIAAKGHGYDPQDIHGFVDLVPMADAEIVRLQNEEGYAYMR